MVEVRPNHPLGKRFEIFLRRRPEAGNGNRGMENYFRFTPAQEVEMAIRLVLATGFGGLIGYERRHADKPAGPRTLALVSSGAALFTMISTMGFGWGDPARVAAQIVTGVGFLGAGTIFRFGADVRGLTTAASIWIAAAIGMAAGAGMYIVASVGTTLILVVLEFPKRR